MEHQYLYLTPVVIRFPDGSKKEGLLAHDDQCLTYVLDVAGLPIKHPLDYLHGALSTGGITFENMMKRAYERHAIIKIEGVDRDIFWQEYEHLFAKRPFYQNERG